MLILLLGTPLAGAGEQATVLILGDSLSANHGLDSDQGWVNLLERRLQQHRPGYRVVNASISGDTTQGALNRLPRALAHNQPQIVIIELGGNDGLRGVTLNVIQANLLQLVELSQRSGARVLLLGMQLPPNYGAVYTQRFHAIYTTVAKQSGAALVPFLLEGVAQERSLMQADGIHPTAQAQARLLETVWTPLQALLEPQG